MFQSGGDIKIHGDIGKGGLKTDPGWNIDVEDKFLKSLFDFFVIQPIIANKRGKEGIEIGNGLGSGGFTL